MAVSYTHLEYTNAWSAMFIQSALLFGYYLLPFSMVVVCVMIANRETKNNGILKMLALPISKEKLALTKFFVLLSFLAIQLLIFFISFVIAGIIATKIMNVTESIPVFYLLTWTLKLFTTMIPAISCMSYITKSGTKVGNYFIYVLRLMKKWPNYDGYLPSSSNNPS